MIQVLKQNYREIHLMPITYYIFMFFFITKLHKFVTFSSQDNYFYSCVYLYMHPMPINLITHLPLNY